MRVGVTILGAAMVVLAVAMAGWKDVGQAAEQSTIQAARDPRWTQFTQQPNGLRSDNIWAILAEGDGVWFGGEAITRFDGAWASYAWPADAEDAGLIHVLVKGPGPESIWAGTDGGFVLEWNGVVWSSVVRLHAAVHTLAAVSGEIWIGTDEGLYRFDGSTPVLVDAVGRQPIFALAVDRGTVWAGTQNGLWRYREERWLQIGRSEPRLADGVYALMIDRGGALITGTPYGVGWRLREGVAWEWFDSVDEMGHPALVHALAEDTVGRIWAGTDGAGAFALRLRDQSQEQRGFTGDQNLTTRFVRNIAIDIDGSVWFATPAGAFRYQGQMWVADMQGESADDPRNFINDLLVDRSGILWVATGGGGVRRKQGENGPETVYSAEEGATAGALTLEEDIRGAIWVGGFNGLHRYTAGVWTTPIAEASLPYPVVTTLVAEGSWLWIGTEAGLARYQVTTEVLEEEAALMGQTVEAMALDNLERLWVGTQDNGLWLREGQAGWRHFVHNPNDPSSLPGDYIIGSGLAADPNVAGGMWVLLYDEGLVHWDGDRWRQDIGDGMLPSPLLWALYTDPSDGSLWIGSEAGVTRYDGRTWGTLSIEDGLQSAMVYAIAQTHDGGYWIGGRAGLTRFKPDTTPPWIRLGTLTGEVQTPPDRGDSQIVNGTDAALHFSAGDLQTDRARLAVFQRLVGPGLGAAWAPLTGEHLTLHFSEPGDYTLELMARDQSFNYSDIASMRMTSVVPPVEIEVPVLGLVATGPLRALMLLGSIALLGAGYITWEVLNDRRRSLDAVERAYNPYISGEPVRRNDMFFGRRDLVQRIVDTLHNNSIMIYGERRIGKTSLLYQLVMVLREVADPDYWFVPIFVDLEGTPQEIFFHYLIEEIVIGIESLKNADEELLPHLDRLRLYTIPGRDYTDRDFNRDLNRLTEVLQTYGEQHDPGKQLRLILLMDEMDVMSRYDALVQQQLRRIFMREFAATLGAVVAGIQISKDWDRVESPWYNLFNEIALTPFSREQAIELLVEPVRGFYRFDPAAIEFVLDHALGRPYKIQQYGLEAVNHMLAQRRRRIQLVDVKNAHWRIRAAEQEMESRPSLKRKARMAVIPVREPEGSVEQSSSMDIGRDNAVPDRESES